MKQGIIIIIGALILTNLNLFSQADYKNDMDDKSVNFYEVCRKAELYFSSIDKEKKGSGWMEYQRWKSENEGHYFPDGIRNNFDYYSAANTYQTFVRHQEKLKSRSSTNSWKDLGPYSANRITTGYNPGIGRVETFWVDPKNMDVIYMGSRSGGFWKTSNGGASWKNTTDFLVASGVNTMDVDPYNNLEVLINLRNANNGTSHGVYISNDQGENWTPTAFGPQNNWGGLGTNHAINIIKFHPLVKDQIFLGTSRGLYRSNDHLKTWTNLFSGGNITDIAFHPIDPKIIYVFDNGGNSNRNVIQISTDGGLSFKPSATISGNNDARGRLAVSPKAPDFVFFASNNGVWRSSNKGQNFLFLSKPVNSCAGFTVSDLDEKIILYGNVDIEVSWNAGLSFTQVTRWANTNPDHTYTHADLRIADCVNGVFFVGTDGYLCKSEDQGRSWIRLNDGTGIREFYRMGICQSDVNHHIAGSQDNGTSISYGDQWTEWNGGDGMEAIIFPLNPKVMIGSWQYGTRNITYNGGLTRDGISTPDAGDQNADWISPLLIDPSNHYHIYHFGFNVNRNSSFGNPTKWDTISSPKMGMIKHAVMAENNSNIMVICRDSSLRLSTDKGISWKSINRGLPPYSISDVSFDPRRDSTILISYDRYQNDGQKIFLSHDLGNTWKNITSNLGNMPIRCLAIDHSPSSIIYAGAEIGVYYKKMHDSVWTIYNKDLPNVTIRDFEIHHGANSLKAVTWGRGLFEIPLVERENYPAIQVVQTTDTIDVKKPLPINQHQQVKAQIMYQDSITSAYVLYGNDKSNLHQRTEMTKINGQWITQNELQAKPGSQFMFFKVIAIGEYQDTSETYIYMYALGACKATTKEISLEGCGSVNVNGNEITESKVLRTIAKDQYGCDSASVIYIRVDARADTSLFKDALHIFAASNPFYDYQWFDCSNSWTALPGETSDIFTPTKNGQYAVVIRNGLCTDSSACIPFIHTAVGPPDLSLAWSIIPNPAHDMFYLSGLSANDQVSVVVFDMYGKQIKSYSQLDMTSQIPFQIPAGLYHVIISNGEKQFINKWMIY